MALHICFVIFGKTARENGDSADGATDVGKLATSIRALAYTFVFGGGWYYLWTSHAGESLGYRSAEKALRMSWW